MANKVDTDTDSHPRLSMRLAGLLLLGLIVVVGGLIAIVLRSTGGSAPGLTALAVGGVIVLILLLALVATVFRALGLQNKNEAMGLPEGSIRAVIALSLIVLFAILSVYLFENLKYGTHNSLIDLSKDEYVQFLKDHPTAKSVEVTPVKDKSLYDVEYYGDNPASVEDYAKQLLVLLGTLMTAITSFYLGANTATKAAAVGAQSVPDTSKPTISDLAPRAHSIAKNGKVITLQVTGSNLNSITHVKIQRLGAQPVFGADVASNPTRVTCKLEVNESHIGAAWTVVVDDGASKSAMLADALTIET